MLKLAYILQLYWSCKIKIHGDMYLFRPSFETLLTLLHVICTWVWGYNEKSRRAGKAVCCDKNVLSLHVYHFETNNFERCKLSMLYLALALHPLPFSMYRYISLRKLHAPYVGMK